MPLQLYLKLSRAFYGMITEQKWITEWEELKRQKGAIREI